MKKLNFPRILKILFILAVFSLAIFLVLENSGNEHEQLELNNSSIEDLKTEYDYQDAKEECEALNGSVVNYSYGANTFQTFIGCEM